VKRRCVAWRVASVVALGVTLPGWVAAQGTAKVPRIGVLRWGVPGDENRPGLTQALAAIGYREGQTITIEWRWATNRELAERHAAELLAMNPDLLVASATPAALVLRDATRSVPIVLGSAADPVGAGLVASLARPGGNITGVSANLPAATAKQVQLLRDTLPGLQRVAFLGSTQDPATRIFVSELEAARAQKLRLQPVLIGGAGEFEVAVDTMQREGAQAVIVQPLFTLGQSGPLAELLVRRRLPASSALRPFAVAGGLMAYGPSRVDTFRRTASFVDRVLKGAAPASLPLEEPTSYELVFNLGTARALGIAIAPAMRLRADEVIQ
jgi:putative tryptophan/tyrosine transport system substrate-binding protein